MGSPLGMRALEEADATAFAEAFAEMGWNKPAAQFSRYLREQKMDAAEALVVERSPVVGLGVGLHSGYGSAQRLYLQRGYVPDGAGVVVDGRSVPEGAELKLDDSLVLRMTKELE
ncbi:MAG: hypothetical protein RQ745_10210 [Longimicrobiales bacterium]|nr:hypothetical protein [Longimicrobiales bacterium]